MIYIVGLGNPGEKYTHTRHNVGWRAVEHWLQTVGLPAPYSKSAAAGAVSEGVLGSHEVCALLPETYMNKAGTAVCKLVSPSEATQLVVVYDDVDIPFGAIKVSVGGGAGGHNGIKSVTQSLGTPDYIRVRIGIAPKQFWTGKPVRPSGAKLPAFVLHAFSGKEERALADVFRKTDTALSTIVTDGVTAAMNAHNADT